MKVQIEKGYKSPNKSPNKITVKNLLAGNKKVKWQNLNMTKAKQSQIGTNMFLAHHIVHDSFTNIVFTNFSTKSAAYFDLLKMEL